MVKLLFKFFSIIFFSLTIFSLIYDIFSYNSLSFKTGFIWSQLSPNSLLVLESIISRYLDPCSVFRILECSPFLWHPIFFSILNLPLTIVLFAITIVFFKLGTKDNSIRKKINLVKDGR